MAGTLIVLDSFLLTWWLWQSGGAVNPFTLFFLTLIALAALVLLPALTYVLAVLASQARLDAFQASYFSRAKLLRYQPGRNPGRPPGLP